MVNEEPTAMLIAMVPVDTSGLDEIAAGIGEALPVPSIEHTIKPCDMCGGDSWIGPAQLLKKSLSGIPAFCYRCLIPMMTSGSLGEVHLTTLDHTADDKLRRTSGKRRP